MSVKRNASKYRSKKPKHERIALHTRMQDIEWLLLTEGFLLRRKMGWDLKRAIEAKASQR
jgi:hypothetical protein